MAEFTLGLTKTAVEGTLSRVKSAIEEEAKLKVRVQNDLVFITGEFQMLQSFLNATNTAEHAKNKVVQTWVRQLRDLAFDVEDCVELVVNLDTNKSEWWWRLVPSCMAPPLPLDVAVAEIMQLKARVEDVSQRSIRYNLMSDKNNQPATAGTIATTSSSTEFNILSQVWEASGKRRGTGDLKKLIIAEGTDLQVISLWGSCSTTGGAANHFGATSASSYIIREAYNDPEICREFKMRARVKLMHPFSPVDFIHTLLAQFYINHHQPNIGVDVSKKMNAAAAAMENKELMQQVNTQRYLIILEDVSSVFEWDAIKMYLPDSNNGSRVIVSTQHLRIALMCTGNPYQVSQLTRFSDGQSICAFSKKGSVRRTDLGEFNWQIRCRGVISVIYGPDDQVDSMRKVYRCISQKRKAFEGVVFGEHSWVDVPNPFNLIDFAVRLFWNFQSSDFEANEIEKVVSMGEQGVIERCCRYLREADCLIILNGLESTEVWDKIKDTFLSGGQTKGTSSIIVLTHDETVAKHCVDALQNRAFSLKTVKHDKVLARLIKDCIGSRDAQDFRRAHLFYDISTEVDYWHDEFKLVGRENEVSALEEKLQNPGVISVWGSSGAGKSVLVRSVYHRKIKESVELGEAGGTFSLVNVPRPFNLKDFSWRLLLDFYSSDFGSPQEPAAFGQRKGVDLFQAYLLRLREKKEAAAVDLMNGEVNPIQACRQRLHKNKCLVVIDGLESKHDWEQIRNAFFSEQPTQSSSSCIIVITQERNVAKHCVGDVKDRLLKVKPFIKNPSFLVGRGKEIGDLTEFNPGVTCLWGIVGVGKSALAKNIYDNYRHYSDSQCKKSWVDVPHPFNLTEFSRRLLLGFHWNDLEAKETAAVGIMEGQDTIEVCCQFLREYQCLIIIYGLTSAHDWSLIEDAFLSKSTQNSYIIAITREESVATHCASDKSRVHNVKGLNAADALDLFTKIAWGSMHLAPEETKFSKHIISKCGGLHEVIAAIGRYVAEERAKLDKMMLREEILTTISKDILHDFMGKLERDPRFQNLKGLFSWMQFYFHACSDSLKPCIFYLSVFPAEHKRIRRKRLLRRWIAEGYSRDTFDDGTAKEKGEKLFDELVELSIIQQRQPPRSSLTTTSKLNDNICQVNGFFREYIISRPMEDNLVFALEGRCDLNSQRTGQHLTIRSCWNRDKVVFKSLDFTRLRSLTVFGEWKPFFISCDINMRLLRVLDLEDTKSGVKDDDIKHIGKHLPRLKFLSLRGCKDVTRLPDSLGDLRQLQTLDVKHTKIVTMPHTIIKLVMLQYLRADPISDEGDGAGPPAEDDNDCASTSSYESCVSIEDDDGMVTPVYTDCMITSQPPPAALTGGDHMSRSKEEPVTADGELTSTSRGGTRNDRWMVLRWAGWCCTKVLFILVGLMLHTFSFGQRCWAGSTAKVAAGLAQSLSTSQAAITIENGDDISQTIEIEGDVFLFAGEIEGDVTSTNQPQAATEDDGTSTRKSTAYGDDMRISQAAEVADEDDTLEYQPTTIHGGGTRQPAAVYGDDTSQRPETIDGDGASTSQTATSNGDGPSTSHPAAKATDGDGTSRPAAAGSDDTSNPAADSSDVDQNTLGPRRSMANDFLSYSRRWLSKKKKTNDGGIKLPAGIGNLTALHTLGVVKVSGAGGKAILKKMKKLTQLRKLRVSGINQQNWPRLCTAISGLDYLESLSVRLDEEDAPSFFSSSDVMFSELPKTLKSLKLYTGDGHGNVQASPNLVKQLGYLNNLRKVNLELTVSTQEDIYSLVDLPHQGVFRLLCVKPIQDGELRYGLEAQAGARTLKRFDGTALKIDCGRYKLAIVFGNFITGNVEVLVVHCSTAEVSLEVSGLEKLGELKEVWLTGSYSEAVEQHLQQKIDEVLNCMGRVLKLKLQDQPHRS